ncbi:hypothetical protein LCGC14_1039930 [marine sediment metagenome]|uniref:Cohesin domain-containing protein n=1 Tax=marine sediment metagenome TaxID=412755 RepID=A0A0F9MS39_9ZZZZ
MARTFTFNLVLDVDVIASGTGTLTYTVSQDEELDLMEIFHAATGAFQINDIRDSVGFHYTNASANNPISSALIAQGANEYNHLGKLPVPINVKGGSTIYFDVQDTSTSSNTIRLIIPCKRTFP